MNRMSTLMFALSGQSLPEPERRHLHNIANNAGKKDSSDKFLNSRCDKKKFQPEETIRTVLLKTLCAPQRQNTFNKWPPYFE